MTMDYKQDQNMAQTVSIIGTGDFACALATRLIHSDYNVIIGSRCPEKRDLARIDPVLGNATVTTWTQAMQKSNMVILAMHAEGHRSLVSFSPLLDGKIVIDVSNPQKKVTKTSIAEQLQQYLPRSHVVKAFNTISAYTLTSQTSGQSKIVYVCGNNVQGKKEVQQMARTMGFASIDSGTLKNAKNIENMNTYLFKGWGTATFISVAIFLGWLLFAYIRYFVRREVPYTPERWAANTTNKVFGATSLTLLAFTFMPGCFAAFLQIINGTKHKRFPGWLDKWLRIRKQLGLHALSHACLHLCLSVILVNPAYYGSWYKATSAVVPLNRTDDTEISISSRMNWNGEVCMLTGMLGVFFMVIQAITSLPSVGSLLNWREWTFAQSVLGYTGLIFSLLHVWIKGQPSWIGHTLGQLAGRMTFAPCVLPWMVILMKMILCLPCVNSYLWRIRRGWERGVQYDMESAVPTPKLGHNEELQMTDTDIKVHVVGNGQVNEAFDSERL